jgi:hypothetical protein
MDKRYKIIIGALFAIIALLILIASSNSQNESEALRIESIAPSSSTIPTITPAEQLEQCKRYIVDNKDFSPTECKGIQEDDSRLNVAYQAISPNGTYDLCEQMYALIHIDNELSGKITNVLIENNLPEDTLVANVDICTDLGYYSVFE